MEILQAALVHVQDLSSIFLDASTLPKDLVLLLQSYVEDVYEFEASLFLMLHMQYHKKPYVCDWLVDHLSCIPLPLSVLHWKDQCLQAYRDRYEVTTYTLAEQMSACLTFSYDRTTPCNRAVCYYRTNGTDCYCGRPLPKPASLLDY